MVLRPFIVNNIGRPAVWVVKVPGPEVCTGLWLCAKSYTLVMRIAPAHGIFKKYLYFKFFRHNGRGICGSTAEGICYGKGHQVFARQENMARVKYGAVGSAIAEIPKP